MNHHRYNPRPILYTFKNAGILGPWIEVSWAPWKCNRNVGPDVGMGMGLAIVLNRQQQLVVEQRYKPDTFATGDVILTAAQCAHTDNHHAIRPHLRALWAEAVNYRPRNPDEWKPPPKAVSTCLYVVGIRVHGITGSLADTPSANAAPRVFPLPDGAHFVVGHSNFFAEARDRAQWTCLAIRDIFPDVEYRSDAGFALSFVVTAQQYARAKTPVTKTPDTPAG